MENRQATIAVLILASLYFLESCNAIRFESAVSLVSPSLDPCAVCKKAVSDVRDFLSDEEMTQLITLVVEESVCKIIPDTVLPEEECNVRVENATAKIFSKLLDIITYTSVCVNTGVCPATRLMAKTSAPALTIHRGGCGTCLAVIGGLHAWLLRHGVQATLASSLSSSCGHLESSITRTECFRVTSALLPVLSLSLSPLSLCRSSHRCPATATIEPRPEPLVLNDGASAAGDAAASESVGSGQDTSVNRNELNTHYLAVRRCFEAMVE